VIGIDEIRVDEIMPTRLIEDDLRRRGIASMEEMDWSVRISQPIGKFIPFYGLAYYFWKRPNLFQDELDHD